MKIHLPNRLLARSLVLGLALLAAGCDDDFKDSLKMTRNAPDEFTVVSRPSLSVPPEFTLRPPHPGEPPREASADATARSMLTGKPAEVGAATDPAALSQPTVDTAVTPVIATTTPTGASAAFLKRAGADDANDKIRDQLTQDVATPADTSQADSLLDQVTGDSKNEPVVDAKKEAERLRENKDEGKPANEGDIPLDAEKPPSVLDRVINIF